jgi:hypothetical protein
MAIVKTQYDYWKEDHDRVMAEMATMQVKYALEDTRPNDHFKYLIKIGKMLEFHAARQWLSQTYGLAEQLDRDTIHNPHWGFEIRLGSSTVYLRGDEELNWFKIRHGDPR